MTLLLANPALSAESAPLMRVYLFRPAVFADTYLGPAVPVPGAIKEASLWYLRFEDRDRARYGMKRLARFIRANGVMGLDFTANKTLTTQELEQLFGTLQWLQLDASAKFRLLKLRGTLADDRALSTLSRLFDLQVLELSENMTDEGMHFLSNLKQLKVLTLSGPQISDTSVDVLMHLPLQRLDLQNTAISNEGLKKLQKLALRQLAVGTAVTDTGLKALQEMTTLEHLDLQRAQVSGKGLATLAGLQRLHTLFLGASYTDADMPALLAFPNLKRLDLTGSKLTDASLATLAQMSGLEELSLSHTAVTDNVWKALKKLPKLRYLDLSGTPITTWKNIQGFEALQVLAISHPGRLTMDDVKPLARLLRLHTLIINGHPLGRSIVNFLRYWKETQSWLMEQLVPKAYAANATEKEVNQALELASLPLSEKTPIRRGLVMIHQVESDLNEVIAAPNMIQVDNKPDTEKNFLGEITINAGSSKSKAKKGTPQ